MADGSGFPVPTYEIERQTIVGEWISGYGPGSNTASDTVDGLLIDILTRIETIHFERLNSAAGARSFNDAVGLQLDRLLAVFGTGHRRLTESGSKVQVLLYGSLGAAIPSGSLMSTLEDGVTYELDESEVIPQSVFAVFVFSAAPSGTNAKINIAGVDYDPITPVVGSGLAVANSVYSILPGGGDSQISQFWAPFEDPNGNGVLVVQMTDKLAFSAVSSNAPSASHWGQDGFATSVEVGPVVGDAFSIVRIGSPQTGWDGVVNLVEATPGRFNETDGLYRIRHKTILGQHGVSTPLAMRAFLSTLEGVELVRIYENKTIANPDAYGRPSHSFEVLIEGGDAEQIAKYIYILHPLGIETYGTESYTVRHRDDEDRIISLSRPTKRYAWVDVEITPGEGFPAIPTADVETDVRARVLAWGKSLGLGRDMYTVGVKQVVDIPGSEAITVKFGTQPNPGDPKPPMTPINVLVQQRELTRFDELRISVVVL